jgi:AcrR family transcriptional regulator
MGVQERKQREKQEMIENIIAAATEMFLTDGYDKTSIRNIAEKIEYSPGTIYLYFPDKDAIFHAIHVRGFELLMKHFRSIENIQHPAERLLSMGKIYITFGLENPEYYDLMFIMKAPLSFIQQQGEWKVGQDAFLFLLQTVHQCIEAGYMATSEKNPFLLSNIIWAFVHGLVSLHVRNRFQGMMNKFELSELPLIKEMMNCCIPTSEEELKAMLLQANDSMIRSLLKPEALAK